MLHSLEHVGDHQNPLADTPTLVSCQAPQLGRPRFAAKKVYRHPPSPKTWYPSQLTLPHLEITGSRYYIRISAGARDFAKNEVRSIVHYLNGDTRLGEISAGLQCVLDLGLDLFRGEPRRRDSAGH